MGGNWSRVRLRKLLPSCITSFSVRRKDSQGCTADVKDTPPSPEEKRAKRHMKSSDSGVSLQSDWSKAELTNSKDRDSPKPDFSSSEEECVVADDEDLVESPDDQRAKRHMKSSDSGVSLKSDWSKAELTHFKDRDSPKGRETNQEVGWKHLAAPVSSCS